ncbi:hypothetical protein Krac_4537 [Ktedonobacter racemifer DSM 44963]|uniref:Uncharacterized protein n=1 Tax=Ktedonobacter racemifer DSM 44963 TaxID=485913 RepID=D6TT02_KTERA|nr:hypothetical protein Krac_4537 [Ktedonobacter racemifer DSM 44963]
MQLIRHDFFAHHGTLLSIFEPSGLKGLFLIY